ncbi:MAG: flavin reductase family protein [Xenococcaceae cyanobacterium]
MSKSSNDQIVSLDLTIPVWDRFFSVAPLVIIGTREEEDGYDLAPKHMAMPLGWENYFGFVCTPRHRTYQNVRREQAFTVSFPRPDQVVLTSLSAAPRCDDHSKPSLAALPTFPASVIDGVFLKDAYLFLECELDRILDGFGQNSLIAGRIVAAHVQQQALRVSDRDDQDLLAKAPLLAYIPPGRYAKIDRSFSFPFHSGFKK